MDLREVDGVGDVRHPWELARAGVVEALIRRATTGTSAPSSVLDVGSGDGWLAAELARRMGPATQFTCVDVNYTDAQIASLDRSTPPNVHHAREVAGAKADLVLALDVIEHVADDEEFAAFLAQSLGPEGRIVVTVPAGQELFGPHDVALGHHRRYSVPDLVSLLERVGLRVDQAGTCFASLYLARRLMTALGRTRRDEGEAVESQLRWSGPAPVSKLVASVLRADAMAGLALGSRGRHVRGLSCWAIAHGQG